MTNKNGDNGMPAPKKCLRQSTTLIITSDSFMHDHIKTIAKKNESLNVYSLPGNLRQETFINNQDLHSKLNNNDIDTVLLIGSPEDFGYPVLALHLIENGFKVFLEMTNREVSNCVTTIRLIGAGAIPITLDQALYEMALSA